MAHANTHAESARIRTILEISAFNLSTLEHELARNAYIPESTDEKDIRDATYRFYIASTSQPSLFYISECRSNIFDPYPYDGAPHHESSGAQTAAAMADRNERESVKYDAVTDLIRMLATRKVHGGKTVAPGAKIEQAAVKVLEGKLGDEKVKTKALEDQLQVIRVAYAAVKVLVGKDYAVHVREIDKWRFRQLMQLAVSPAAAEADEAMQQLAEIEVAKLTKTSSGGQNKAGELQGLMWSEAGEKADGVSEAMSTAAEDDGKEDEGEEKSEISSAGTPSTSVKHSKKRNRVPRALQRARKAAREMAAQAEDEVAQDLAQVSIAESAADFSEKKEGGLQGSMWSAARETAPDVSQETSLAEDVDMSEGQPAASDWDATMEPRRPTIVAQEEKESVQALQLRFQAEIAEKMKAEKMKEAAIQ